MEKQDILNKLKEISYPGFSRDIVSFGLVKEVIGVGNKFKIVLAFTTEPPEKRGLIQRKILDQLKSLPEAADIDFEAFEMPLRPTAERTVLEQREIPGVDTIIAVASGKGGVGKSTVAVNLACCLHRLGKRVGLLDADIYGPSIPMMMGVQERPQITEGKKLIPPQRHGISMMSIGFFLEGDSPVIWRGPMVTGAIRQLLNDTQWGKLDYLIVDLPPGTGDAQLSLVQLAHVKGSVIVSTPQDVALIDAKKGVLMFQKLEVPILGLIENMSIFVCPHCKEKTDIFSEGGGRREAERLKIPFLGEIPIDPSVRIGGDEGVPVAVQYPDSEVSKAFLRAAQEIERRLKNDVK